MNSFIEIVDKNDGYRYLVNANHICMVEPKGNGCVVSLTSKTPDDKWVLYVDNSYDEIIELLKSKIN